MGKIRNISGVDLDVPGLARMVMAGQVVEVPDAEVHSYTCQASTWAPSDKDAQAAHTAGDRELQLALGNGPVEVLPETTTVVPVPDPATMTVAAVEVTPDIPTEEH